MVALKESCNWLVVHTARSESTAPSDRSFALPVTAPRVIACPAAASAAESARLTSSESILIT